MKKLSFIIAMCIFSMPGMAKERKVTLSLSDMIQKAIANNDELKMKDQDVAYAEGRLGEVKSYMFPSASNFTTLAPIFKDTGDALHSTKDSTVWGPWVKSSTTIIQPLYAYGKIKFYSKAATNGIEAEKGQKKMKEAEVVFDVKQYYYSAQAASGILENIEEAQQKLMDVIKRVDELLKAESGEVRKQDAYKLKAVLQELKQKKEFVIKGEKLAKTGLAFKGGFTPEIEINLKDKELKKESFTLQPLEYYQKTALDHRAEMQALNAGIVAKQALVDAEQTNLYPVFFLGGIIDVADTPNRIRNPQKSPYANDPYNGLTGGVGLGAKWNLDFWKVKAKMNTLRADYLKLVRQKEMAEKGLPLEVKKAYLEYQEALNDIVHAKEGQEQTKKWFMQSVLAWGVGVGDSREVLESVIFKGLSDKGYYEALLNHNIAIAALSKATGTELLSSLKY